MSAPSKMPRKSLSVGRHVMARRSEASRHLAQVDVADQIMREDKAILHELAKK